MKAINILNKLIFVLLVGSMVISTGGLVIISFFYNP